MKVSGQAQAPNHSLPEVVERSATQRKNRFDEDAWHGKVDDACQAFASLTVNGLAALGSSAGLIGAAVGSLIGACIALPGAAVIKVVGSIGVALTELIVDGPGGD